MTSIRSHYSLGLDIGTTKVAAAIVAPETREVIATQSLAHNSDVTDLAIGRSEQVVSKILSNLDECVKRLPLEARRRIASIGVTGQMHGVVLWNPETAEVSNLVTWQDQRCLEGNFLARLRDVSGDKSAQSGYGTSTLAWLSAHEPETLRRYSAAATIHDYVVAQLAGNKRPFTDPSDAASFGFFDIRARCWRSDCITEAGIPLGLLPEIRAAGEKVGFLVSDIATRWEVPAGVPIGNALGDNQASLFGSLTDPAKQIALTIGTGAQLSVVVDFLPELYADATERYEFRPYVGDSYIAVVASLSGGRALAALGKALESFMAQVGVSPLPSLEQIQSAMHSQGMNKVSTSLKADASLAGERSDLSLRGSFTNLSFDNFSIGDMTAALSRGLVASLRDSLPREFLASRQQVVGSGNAIHRSPLTQQVIRETFGCDLKLQKSAEPTACGAALLSSASSR